MTLNKLTREMKAKGFEVEKYSCTYAGEYSKTTYTTYLDESGKEVMEIKGHNGVNRVFFIHPEYKNSFDLIEGVILN